MRNFIFILIYTLLFLGCAKNQQQEKLLITVTSLNNNYTDREGKDYIKCWVDDSLLFSGVYKPIYDSLLDSYLGTTVAETSKSNRDSVKIRIRLIALDSLLFAEKAIVDTSFIYRVNNISIMTIVALRPFKGFDIYDPISCPAAFEYE